LVYGEAETVVQAGDTCKAEVVIAVGLVVMSDTLLDRVLIDRLLVVEGCAIVDEVDEASLETEGGPGGTRAATLNIPKIVLSCRRTPGPFFSQHIP
jgi:hypothetical protein